MSTEQIDFSFLSVICSKRIQSDLSVGQFHSINDLLEK